MKLSAWLSAGLVLLMLSIPATEASAQRGRRARPTISLGIHTGVGLTGRFIEQDVLPDDSLPPLGQRILTTPANFNLGASVGAWAWDRTLFELSYTWVPTHFNYRDDTGTDSDRFDQDDIASLNMHIFTIEVNTFVLPERARFNPFIRAGYSGTFFVLGDEGRTGLIRTNESHFRVGGKAGLGVRYRANPNWALLLSANFFGLGNPFRGKDAFVPTTGLTFDKPDGVRLTSFMLGATYTFWRHRR
jgi:outer membrane protein W